MTNDQQSSFYVADHVTGETSRLVDFVTVLLHETPKTSLDPSDQMIAWEKLSVLLMAFA